MNEILIQGCELLRLQDGQAQVELDQDILIRGNRIAALGKSGSLSHQPGAELISARGMLAMPGLVNTHAHVPMVLFRGLVEDVTVEAWFNDHIWPLESNLTAEDVYWGAMLGIAEMIENGVTTFADHYFYMDEVAQAVQVTGVRANLAWAVFSHEGEEKLQRTIEFIQKWQAAAGGRITTWLGPHAPYTTGPDYLRLCARKAQDLGVGIHIHVSESEPQVRLSLKQYGITPVKMLAETGILDVPAILAHCVYPSDDDLDIMAQKPCGVAHAPKTYLKLGDATAPVLKFRERGIVVGLATDGAASNNSLDILEQLRLMALTQKQMSADPTAMTVADALDVAFNGGAHVLHQEKDLGMLAPGKLADVVLIRQDGLHVFPRFNPAANLVYSSRSADVDTVICDGKLLMRNRQLLTIDREQVRREVAGRLERLNQRVPGRRVATYPVE